MFSDFLACCWDYIANEIPKVRYMTGGQVTVPLVVRTANGGGLGFGAQHSQAGRELGVRRPRAEDRRAVDAGGRRRPAGVGGPQRRPGRSSSSTRACSPGKARRSPPDHVIRSARPRVRPGDGRHDRGAGLHGPDGARRRGRSRRGGISAEVIDLRCLSRWTCDRARLVPHVPLLIVEENPTRAAWGGTVAVIVADEGFERSTPDPRVAAVRPAAVRRRAGGRGDAHR
jgi:pyruvate dehydrogenase E1 component beta subunit